MDGWMSRRLRNSINTNQVVYFNNNYVVVVDFLDFLSGGDDGDILQYLQHWNEMTARW
jgi:hypothetical protein